MGTRRAWILTGHRDSSDTYVHRLIEADAPQIPIPSFIEKSEWMEAFDDFHRVYPDLNCETS